MDLSKKLLIALIALVALKWWFTDPSIAALSSDVSFNYVVRISGNGGDRLPMLVALHGNGDTPSHFFDTALDEINTDARIILVEGPLDYGRGYAWPWRRSEFETFGGPLREAIDLLAVRYPTVGKPVLVGFSGGGMMAYYQALMFGDGYSTIVPVSGQLSADLIDPDAIRSGASVVAYHGRSDSVIGISGGRAGVDLLTEHDVETTFIDFESGHHGLFTDMKGPISRRLEQALREAR